MHRPRYFRCYLLAPVLIGLVFAVAGCAGSEHDLLIKKFFTASGAGDTMTLGNIATVSFDPTTQGRAQNVTVVSESPEKTRVLRIKELDQAYKDAQAAAAAVSKDMKDYQDKNAEAISRVLKVQQSGAGRLTGRDLEVQKAWDQWREKSSAVEKKLSEARQALNAERRVADLSVPDKDASAFEATEVTKEVTVTANVRTPDNQSTKKTMVLTLQRVILKDQTGKPPIEGKWMITDLKEVPAAK
jgi:hypothetical protein